jgi:hypothetical protein
VIARVSQFLATSARHAIPIGGIFGREWHPVTALAVYWLESILLALAAAMLAAMLYRRTSDRAVAEARRAGDDEEARHLRIERGELHNAHIVPRDVLGFYVGSFLVFGVFLGGVTFIMTANGRLEPPRWGELSQAAQAIAIVVAISVTIDLCRFNSLSVRAVQSRVDACLARWSLFWLVGFVGTLLTAITGQAAIIFGFFAVLKVIFESWARIASVFGWKSLKERGLVVSPVSVKTPKE